MQKDTAIELIESLENPYLRMCGCCRLRNQGEAIGREHEWAAGGTGSNYQVREDIGIGPSLESRNR